MFQMPPSANMYWRTRIVRAKNPSPKMLRMSGGYMAVTYMSKDGKEYKDGMKNRLIAKGLNVMSRAPVEVWVVVCPATNRVQDIDNRIKPLLDSMKELVYIDDSQVWRYHVTRGPVIKGGRVVITVKEMIPDAAGELAASGWRGK